MDLRKHGRLTVILALIYWSRVIDMQAVLLVKSAVITSCCGTLTHLAGVAKVLMTDSVQPISHIVLV